MTNEQHLTEQLRRTTAETPKPGTVDAILSQQLEAALQRAKEKRALDKSP